MNSHFICFQPHGCLLYTSRLRDSYILTPDKLEYAKKTLKILHPLPRVNEISTKIDGDERACYFKQVKNGKFIRMALILMLLSEAENEH